MMNAALMVAAGGVPSVVWVAPFVALLLCVALLPLFKSTAHWWHANSSKLLVSLVCAGVVLGYYAGRGFGVHLHGEVPTAAARAMGLAIEADASGKGFSTGAGMGALVGAALNSAWEYIPFIVMLFSLYAIAGGIVVRGRLGATPAALMVLMGVGGVLASLIGTTGASVLLIRPLLKALEHRRHKVHTVVFFIFIVSNIGGTMLPIGDPPLFVGFLRGVPFLWTLTLWGPWAFMMLALLAVFFVWDTLLWRRERAGADAAAFTLPVERGAHERVGVAGMLNAVWLVLVVLCVATLAPGSEFPGTSWVVPALLREGAMLALVGVSFMTTAKGLRAENKFDWFPIAEVAALFLGIFVALQVPLEILAVRGGELGLTQPWQYFWATGALSAFLDNAPTYAVFFQTALAAPADAGNSVTLMDGSLIRDDLLAAVSLGAVFMGACTYIGNGPNFMVKAIAEEGGVKMPGFFGYMGYAAAVLLPLLAAMTLIFLI